MAHGDILEHFRHVKTSRRIVGAVVGRRFAGRLSKRPHLDVFWAVEAVVIARAVVGVVFPRGPVAAARNVSVAGFERRREAAWTGGHGVHRLARLMRETTRSILSWYKIGRQCWASIQTVDHGLRCTLQRSRLGRTISASTVPSQGLKLRFENRQVQNGVGVLAGRVWVSRREDGGTGAICRWRANGPVVLQCSKIEITVEMQRPREIEIERSVAASAVQLGAGGKKESEVVGCAQ